MADRRAVPQTADVAHSLSDARRITVWVCDECDYWRQEKSTGVHQTFITASLEEQKQTGSRNVIHKLRAATFMEMAE